MRKYGYQCRRTFPFLFLNLTVFFLFFLLKQLIGSPEEMVFRTIFCPTASQALIDHIKKGKGGVPAVMQWANDLACLHGGVGLIPSLA